jgi:hypothetical protein
VSYPRRQQYRRIVRAIRTTAAAAAAGSLAVAAAGLGAFPLSLLLLLVTVVLGARARYWTRLAGRSRVGAHSEEQVRHTLAPLAAEGWRLRHSLTWQRQGDIDSLAIAPTGIAFAIETKAKTFNVQHVARVHAMAKWLHARRRHWCRHGALPVLCVVHARQLEHIEVGVLIVSLDRLPAALRTAAGARPRPTFLAPTRPGR